MFEWGLRATRQLNGCAQLTTPPNGVSGVVERFGPSQATAIETVCGMTTLVAKSMLAALARDTVVGAASS